jgi:hypothetical protein
MASLRRYLESANATRIADAGADARRNFGEKVRYGSTSIAVNIHTERPI